jgi:hypothetical protein
LQIPHNTFFATPLPPVHYVSTDAAALGSFTVTTSVQAPEPSSLALLGPAIAGLLLSARRLNPRRRRARADREDLAGAGPLGGVDRSS